MRLYWKVAGAGEVKVWNELWGDQRGSLRP